MRFFGFSKLESVTHVGENMLSRLRDGLLQLDPERTSVLLALGDAVRVMLANIESTGNDGDNNYQELIGLLTGLLESPKVDSDAPMPDSVPAAAVPSDPQALGETLIRAGKVEAKEVLSALKQQIEGDPLRVGEILVEKGLVQTQDVREAVSNLQESKSGAVADTNIRVDVSLLDKLMNLVGELVLARNQILQYNATQKDTSFLSTTQRLNLITTELQEGVMKTRMQPIGNIWNRFPRVVRDLAVTCGKEVRLELEGKETELDKTIIEAIKDPLTHIVRNSVDHGIETPEVRKANGKPAAGTLLLRAFHEGGQVNIEISDDGAGVDSERVKSKAIERGLINREQAARMTDREAIQLLFLPGFSTAEKVTNVSGRGVGLDVVKTNIEKIGGTVDLQSKPGQGATLKIKIPLTLAIIPALIVTSRGDRFAIPQISLLELVRLEGEQAQKSIESIHGAPVYRLRGNLLPLVYLNHELGLDTPEDVLANTSARIDFQAAREKHLAWKNRIRGFLDGKQGLSQAEAVSHKDCALGKWLYSEGLKQYGHLALFDRLEEAHRTLHSCVAQAVRLKESGDASGCEDAYGQIVTLSEKIVANLDELERQTTGRTLNIVVLQADERQFGLVVEGINDTEEIVVKPLGKLLKNIPVFAGATIMGDGRVALILDVLGIAQRANVVSEVRDRTLADLATKAQDNHNDKQTLLLLGIGKQRLAAIPLSMVARLEEIPTAHIERADKQEVVQYRGQIMPLIRLTELLGAEDGPAEKAELMQVVVYSERGRSVGLVVDRILDIVETTLTVQRETRSKGIVASAVIQQRVTDLLDVHGIIREADPSFFESAAAV